VKKGGMDPSISDEQSRQSPYVQQANEERQRQLLFQRSAVAHEEARPNRESILSGQVDAYLATKHQRAAAEAARKKEQRNAKLRERQAEKSKIFEELMAQVEIRMAQEKAERAEAITRAKASARERGVLEVDVEKIGKPYKRPKSISLEQRLSLIPKKFGRVDASPAAEREEIPKEELLDLIPENFGKA